VRVPGEPAHRALLAQEAVEVVGLEVGAQYLDGNLSIQQRLLAAEYQSEAAAADFFDVIEPGFAQLRGDAEDLLLLHSVRIRLGH
jgi:hypothetical protein